MLFLSLQSQIWSHTSVVFFLANEIVAYSGLFNCDLEAVFTHESLLKTVDAIARSVTRSASTA